MAQRPTQRANGEGSVYRDGERWIAQVMEGGKKRRRTAKTEAEARRRLREMLGNIDQGMPLGDGGKSVGDLLAEWSAGPMRNKDRSPSTLTNYEWAVKLLVRELGKKRLLKLEAEDVETVFERLVTPGRRPGNEGDLEGRNLDKDGNLKPLGRESLIKLRSVLNQAMSYAVRRKYVPINIAEVVELPAAAARTKQGRALTRAQANTLLEEIDGEPLEALFLTMLILGLRPGEAAGLAWDLVDIERGIVHVRQSLKVHNGRLQVTDSLKTDKSRRSLDAPPLLVDKLRVRRAHQNAARLATGPIWSNPDDLVFTTTTGSPLSPSNVRRKLRQLTSRAGLGVWTPNELRHSAASLLSDAGVHLEQIGDQLGHDGTRMTNTVYRHAVTPTIGHGRVMGDILGGEAG